MPLLDSLVSNIRHSLMDVLLNLEINHTGSKTTQVTFVLDKTDWKCYVKDAGSHHAPVRFYLN